MRKVPKRHKGKAKRWPKGQSSNSNPETKKYRDAARSRFFRHEPFMTYFRLRRQWGRNHPHVSLFWRLAYDMVICIGDHAKKSTLTVGALKTFDAFNNRDLKVQNKTTNSDFEDATTFDSWASAKTFKTFASDWSECSNMSFNRLLKKFVPTSALHKEMLAVLAAITEVIKSQGGKETTTEYYGALMTALTVTESEESVTATLSLLSMCIKTVPQEVLRARFSDSTKVLLELLAKFCEVENAVILRSVIGCLSVLLRAQDPGVWSNSSTVEIFHSILVFVTHSKPRIRKAAQHAVCAILKASTMFSEEDIHPAAVNAAKYCITQIEKGETLGGNTTTLHILTVLKDIAATFPKSYIKSACETVLKLMTLGNPLTVTCCFEVLHGLFISQPPSNRLTPSLNAQILNALYDYQPSINDSQATLAWLTVMQEAHKALVKNDPQLCLDNVTKFFVTASHLWLNDKMDIVKGATVVLRVVAMDCLPACCECPNYDQISRNVFSIVENGLTYQYHMAWAHVFNLLGVLFEVFGKAGESYMTRCLKSLASLRDSQNFMYRTELDHTIGKAIRSLGPEIVMKAIPLVITGNETNYDFKTSWILPLLKENIQSADLKFFIEYFLPLAAVCERKYADLKAKNEKVGAHVYELLQLQIWSILPAFCNNVQDVHENFKKIAKILGTLITERKQLRLPAMASLRKLITRSLERPDKTDSKEMGRFAKNYLPILFTLYTTKAEGSDVGGERLAAFDTIKVYLNVANEEISTELFDKALKKMDEGDCDAFTKESIMDLLKLLIPFQNVDRLSVIYKKCITAIKHSKEKKDEKKAYRLLEVLVASDSTECKNFMNEKSKELIRFILKSLKRNDVKYRGARLRCILHLLRYIPENNYNALKEIVPEAVICCRDINQRTRAFAFKLLEQIFIICRKWSDKEEEDIIREYVNMILGGLAGTPTLVSATVLALAKLTSTLRTELPSDVVKLLLDSICLLLALPTREIVGSALTYVKVFITAIAKPQLFAYVPAIVKAIINMVDDCRNHFRLKTRDILDRLLRKFGYETIKMLVPEDDVVMHKRLKNLKRIHLKKQAHKSETDDEENSIGEFALKAKPKSIDEILASSEDESEDEEEEKKKFQEKGQSFIQEDADNIIDFLTPTACGKITATKPEVKKKKKERDVNVASDGRLIILDENEKVKNESDSDLDDIESMMSEVAIGKKRKLSASSDGTAKYQAGGSGIHRPVQQGVKKIKREKTKSKKNELPSLKTGKEYRAKKARGDIKLKGKPDPYAYIPLSRKLLNKRKRQKNNAQFKGVVRAALKGAKKGSKAKMRKHK